MNLIIKMMDRDNKSFRMLVVEEPVDIKVNLGTPPNGNHGLVIQHALPGKNRSYPITGNVYIMNASGDTISKITEKDLEYPGMGGLYKESLTDDPGAVDFDLPALLNGADPVRIAAMAREIMFSANPNLREALAKAGLAPGGVAESEEEYDSGTILANFHGNVGAYLDGSFFDAYSLTAKRIQQYNVYATKEMIKELREGGLIPESKLAMLEANYVKANAKPARDPGPEEDIPSVKRPFVLDDPDQLKYYNTVFGNFSKTTKNLIREEITKTGNRYPGKVIILSHRKWLINGLSTLVVLVDDNFIAEFSEHANPVYVENVSSAITQEHLTAMISAESSDQCEMQYYGIGYNGTGLYYLGNTFKEANKYIVESKGDLIIRAGEAPVNGMQSATGSPIG